MYMPLIKFFTCSLRTSSGFPEYQTGTAYTTEVYFHVSWAWLTVPILSVAVTLIFLLLTIQRTRQSSIPAWRSSPLAMLQALDPSIRVNLGGDGMATNSEMEGLLGKEGVYVRLRSLPGERWELAT